MADLVRLSDVAVINPRLRSALAPNEEVSFAGMANMSEVSGSLLTPSLRPYAEVAKGFTPFERDDLLIAKITPCFENGKIGRASIGTAIGFGSTEFHVVRPDSKKLDAGYLRHFLRAPRFRKAGELRMTGSGGQRRVPTDYVANTLIPLPPLDEQRRTASILEKVDELRAKRREALAHLDTLAQSIFDNSFRIANPVTLTFGEICSGNFRNGVSPSSKGSVASAVLTLSAVTGASFDEDAHKPGLFDKEIPVGQRVNADDLLICRGNGNVNLVGRGHFAHRNMAQTAFPDTIIAARPRSDVVTRLFLESIWNSPFVRSQIEKIARTTNGTFKVNQQSLGSLQLPVPPIELQREFDRRVAAVERLKEHHRTQLAQLDALFASLQDRAFKGEL